MYPDDGEDITSLVKNADTAMYQAKKLGKNTYHYYDQELSVIVHKQLQIEQALKEALAKEQMFLNYQPQYLLDTKEIIAFEALVRWIHPEIGFVPPDKFIPIAEDTGSIVEIGRFVFEKACEDFKKFKEVKKNLKYIAINISSIQFKDKNFINDITSIVKKYDLKPNEVELEVTERYLMDFSKNNLHTIDMIRDLGFRFSIDDFGTGYSSMSYLTKLPIDVIKVDKSFIDGIPKDNNNIQISKAIIVLSKSLGFSVTAEGIENSEQEDFLKIQKCNLGQGYLFSKPLSFEDSLALLKKE
ncbi:MAG: putative bifunctional diguanylate cyclase/phosphodiesterase [Halarcobacter sp.]